MNDKEEIDFGKTSSILSQEEINSKYNEEEEEEDFSSPIKKKKKKKKGKNGKMVSRYDGSDDEEVDILLADDWKDFEGEEEEIDEEELNMSLSKRKQQRESAKTVKRQMTRKIVLSLIYILLWYTFSTFLSLYNKWMIGRDEGQKGFSYPFLMTTSHFFSQFVFSGLILLCFPSLRPKVKISWKDYFMRVVPSGVATSTDIGLSNLSFRYITLSFYVMCKSSAPAFLLFFAFLFRLEKLSFVLIGIVTLITLGIFLAVLGETNFHVVGFILVMVASVLAGLRWTITQMLLQKEKLGMSNPFATLYYLAPVMTITLFSIAIPVEKLWELPSSEFFNTPAAAFETLSLIAVGALLAYCMVIAEFFLIRETSAVTFMVAGIVKEVLTIIVSVIIFEDPMGPANILGLCFVILGVSLYNVYKYRKSRKEYQAKQKEAALREEFELDGEEAYAMKPVTTSNGNGH